MDYKTKIQILNYWLKDHKNTREIPPSLSKKVDEDDIIFLEGEIGYTNLNLRGIRAYKQELEQEKRDIEIISIQKEQKEILKKQNKFNLILALATTVLAIGIFLERATYIANNPIDFEQHWLLGSIFYVSLGVLLAIMGGIIVILVKILFERQKK